MHFFGVFASLFFLAALTAAKPINTEGRVPDTPYKPSTTSSASFASTTFTSTSTYRSATGTWYKSLPTPSNSGKPASKGPGNAYPDQPALPAVVPVNTRSGNQDLISKLLTAAVEVDRVKALDQPGDFVFDFNPDKAPKGSMTSARLA